MVKVDKDRRIAARDEGMRLLSDWRDYCQQHQSAILKDLDAIHGLPATAAALLSPAEREEIAPDILNACLEAEQPFTDSPMFVAPVSETPAAAASATVPDRSRSGDCPCPGMAMLVTPPLL